MEPDEDKKPHLCTMCHTAFLHPEELREHVMLEHAEEGTSNEISAEFNDVTCSKVEPNPDIEITLKAEIGVIDDVVGVGNETLTKNETDNGANRESTGLTSYGNDQSLSDDLSQDAEDAVQCKMCPAEFTTNQDLQEHMSTHDESMELIQPVKEEKESPVVMGSCFINMYAACRKDRIASMRNFFVNEDSENDSDDESANNEDFEPVMEAHESHSETCEPPVVVEKEETESSVSQQKPKNTDEKNVSALKQTTFHECEICNLNFKRKVEWVNHMVVHGDKKDRKVLQCDKCDKTFKSKNMLRLHSMEHRKGKVHKCTKCDRSFATNARFEKHLASHDKTESPSKKKFQCNECHKEFATGNHLKQHMMIHTGFRPYQCAHCGKGFIKRADLLRHETTHSDVKPYLCSLCAKGFGTSCQLKFHMMRHSGETPFTCTTCGKGFIAQKYLRIHERLHSGKKPFLCNQCGKGLSSRKRLKAHIMLHTGEKAFPCTQCDKSYTSKHHLEKHMLVHTEGPYVCAICQRECRGKGNLDRHMKSCSGETRHMLEKYKDVECPICNKTFKKYNLKQHVRIHTGEKPFVCPKCSKAYKRNYLLEEHMRTHSGEKPFVCSMCNKAFARKLNMKVHMRTHTGEKPAPHSKNMESSSLQTIHERQTLMQGMLLNMRPPELPYDYTFSSALAQKEKSYSKSPSPPHT